MTESIRSVGPKNMISIQLGINPMILCRTECDKNVIQTRDHAEMMRRGHLWQHPSLPLKRRTKGKVCLAHLSKPFDGKPMIIQGDFEHHGIKWVYSSPESAVSLGWEVD